MRTLRILYRDIPIRDLAKYCDVIHKYCDEKGYNIELGGAEYPNEPPYLFMDFWPAEDASIFMLNGGLQEINETARTAYYGN